MGKEPGVFSSKRVGKVTHTIFLSYPEEGRTELLGRRHLLFLPGRELHSIISEDACS